MPTKMLIDAAHPEETRVVVVRDNKVEEFDFEAANRRQLRGNIYLAKVTRVEPSLQAAFIDYGGNRHGFLAFSEIHPDYYQIPYADRQALIEADEADRASDDAEENGEEAGEASENPAAANGDGESDAEPEASGATVEEVATSEDDSVESVGGDDAMEEVPVRKSRPRRTYKIQEVIKKRQVLLVQVVKEERGNKGAALTTYLSLAGRYSVLMPNTARGGGISRKIVNSTDRKRLKGIAGELEVPEGMGVILRTAGAARTKTEIKRDFEYLLRLWENVRELTLKSVAPTLVYEEGSLVKRAIRDLYTKDIDQVLVAGDQAYREAKDFMRMLMPSHAKNIQPYRDPEPIFAKTRIEAQLDAMFSPQVTLKSGGYIVLNQTEALVSIDVNSGRSTREHNIEDTALKTNLEAADEVARQLRLRDLAGLIVIDFIDMDEKRNNRAVERRMKDALRHDRARIQVGRISHFGLLEMSRQRIRSGVLESTMQPCPHCEGTGRIRSIESVALHLLRTIENELLKGKPTDLKVRTRTGVALYVLNQKRTHLRELETRFSVIISIDADESVGSSAVEIEKGEPARAAERDTVVRPISVVPGEDEVEDDVQAADDEADDTQAGRSEEDSGPKRRRRRRRRRGSGGESASDSQADAGQEASGDQQAAEAESADTDDDESAEKEGGGSSGSRRRRRGRRGGRRHRNESPATAAEADEAASSGDRPDVVAPSSWEPATVTEPQQADEPAKAAAEPEAAVETESADETAETAPETPEKKPAPRKRAPRRSRAKAAQEAEPASAAADADPVTADSDTADAEIAEVGEVPAAPADELAQTEPADGDAAEPAPVEPEPEQEPEPEKVAEPVAAEAVDGETGPETAEEPAAAEEKPVVQDTAPSAPPRRGWWRRRTTAGE
ncbi:ribonuclease E/G [Microbaculum marinum]|uniref:Ribonuclease E n=1 Tax=Microbaculum marinum TaxID=1764581 RepID=A0AAW9RIE1_9HYPH